MIHILGKQKLTSLLLAVFVLVFNAFQFGVATAKGLSTPELANPLTVTVDQGSQDNDSDDPELDDFIPVSFNRFVTNPVHSGHIPAINRAVVVNTDYSIQARAPPIELV